MTNPRDPKVIAREMVSYGETLADQALSEMSSEECVVMVRDFCSVMNEWQPVIAESDNPIEIALHSLTIAEMFRKAFVKAYQHTDARVSAVEALKRAFGESDT